jgi:hypothetical protein
MLPFLLLLTSFAFAGECEHTIDVSISRDSEPSHVVYRLHDFDVAAYANQSHFGFRDSAPLNVDAGNGDWCFNFGGLRAFQEVMGNDTGIAVTVNGQQTVRLNVDYNEFHITGLRLGDVVTIEFISPFTPIARSCTRTVNEAMRNSTRKYGSVPMTLYTCEVEPMEWKVIERRQYTVAVPTPTPPAPIIPVPAVNGDANGFGLK